MDFTFTEDQEMIRELAAQFSEEVCKPEAEHIDATHEFPIDTWRKMAEVGLIGVNHREQYGGSGIDPISEMIVIEELSKASLTHGATYALIAHGFPSFIEAHGTEEQKNKYLPKVIQEGYIGSFCLTEPGAGSDVKGIRTNATKDGDFYIINGTKCFITAGSIAESLLVVARADEKAGEKGYTGFIIEKGTPGLSVGKIENKMGICGLPTAEIILEDVRVHKSAILGGDKGIGRMLGYALSTLDAARIGTGAQALGVAQASYDLAVKYSNERKQFGRPINSNQGIQWYLAEMASKLEISRLLVYKSAWLLKQGKSITKEAAMTKLYASKYGREVVNLALQIHGGYGYMRDFALERMYRDIKITEIYEGSSEIMKVVISSDIIKKYDSKLKF